MKSRATAWLAGWGLLSLVLGGCVAASRDGRTAAPSPRMEVWREFVVVAYPGPPPQAVNDARYREIAEAGIDIIVPANGTFTAAQNLRAMDLAQAAGLRVIPIDTRIHSFVPAEVRSV
ncbi:MAG: hypothetical protein IT579_05200, partial [Verrucomicrobia subdivision 3 bacterium]|nr:hypothetical protein [Limisphaerales bacterium]